MSNLENNTTELQNILAAVNALPDAGSGTSAHVVEKDVNFWDYDGTLLYSYTLEEIQSMTELPPDPTPKKDFLTFQGWNWTLDEIKAAGHWLDVGAIYITSDGRTRAVVEIADIEQPTIKLNYLGATCNVDWGDGTVEQLAEGNHEHAYSETGQYIVALEVVSGALNPTYNATTYAFVGADDLLGSKSKLRAFYGGSNLSANFGWIGFVNSRELSEMTLPNGITNISASAFSNARKLKHLNLPSTLVTVQSNMCAYNYGLERVSFGPAITTLEGAAFSNSTVRKMALPSVSSIGNSALDSCALLSLVHIPDTVRTIGTYVFRGCESLASLTIPKSVTTIKTYAIANCYYMKRLTFLPETPPTLLADTTFTNLPADCIVEVPAASLTAYQEATNYSGIAAQMVGV